VNITVSLFGQMITFAILVWFVWRFLWGPLTQMMADRTRRIADGLASAERGRYELERAEAHSQELLQKTKEEAAEIMAQAQRRAAEVVEEAKVQARTEGDRMLEAARSEIETEVNRAREQLRSEVVAIAVAGAAKVLGREIDENAHNDLLTALVAQI
jgi:F-type H+-transporting ATPase subunit b